MSTYNESDGSDVSTLGRPSNATLQFGGKPGINIDLDNHYKTKVYTSSSPLSGNLRICTARDTPFDAVQILFLGSSRSRIDGVRGPHATTHTFLKLEMPIAESSYPVPRTYEAGRTYTIPFNFVIPNYLTINACNHHAHTDAVHEHHLCLPPTMRNWGKDDFTPDMAHVEYSIKARVFRDEEVGGKHMKLMEASQTVKVLPAYSEQAPLNITKNDTLYTMSKTKTLRKSILSSKLGKVTVSATQPPAVMLSADGRSASSVNTQIDLHFEPTSSGSPPPKVIGVSSKVTAMTYYSAGAVNCFPNLGDWHRAFGADARGSYPSTTSLFSTALDAVKWRQNANGQVRRDSGYSSDVPSETDHSGSSNDRSRRRRSSAPKNPSQVYHTASLQVPISLPLNKKMFVPTFHSCILSRAYVLWLTVSLSSNGSNTTVTLAVPLQVGVSSTEPLVDNTGLPTFEAAIEEAEADAHLRPRTLYMPDVEFERHVLPGYADLVGGRTVAAH
jgi:hypothetical protein